MMMKSASNGGDERVVGIGSRINTVFPPGRVTFSAKGNVPGLWLEGWEESKGLKRSGVCRVGWCVYLQCQRVQEDGPLEA